MADVRLQRSLVVLQRVAEGVYADSDPAMIVRLDLDVYRNMGEPEMITVTVEPGDKLNG